MTCSLRGSITNIDHTPLLQRAGSGFRRAQFKHLWLRLSSEVPFSSNGYSPHIDQIHLLKTTTETRPPSPHTPVKAQQTFHSERLNGCLFKLYFKGPSLLFFFKVLLSLTVIFIYHIILTPGMSAHVISILCFFSQGLNMLLAFFPISLKRTKKELFEGYLTPTYFSNLKVQFFLSCHM